MEGNTMKKFKSALALLLTVILVAGAVIPVLADEDVEEMLLSAVQTEDVSQAYGEECNTDEAIPYIQTEENEALLEEAPDEVSAEEISESEKQIPEEEGLENAEEEEPAEEPAEKVWSKNPIINNYYKNGKPTPTTKTIVSIFKTINSIKCLLQGRFFWGDDNIFDAELSEEIVDLCSYMKENSALDINLLLTNLPDLTDTAKIINMVFPIDVTELRTELYAQRDELWGKDDVKANLLFFLGAYLSGITKAYAYVEPYGDTGYYTVCCDITYSDGVVEKFIPGIIIDLETGKCFGENGEGMWNIGFNCDVYDLLVYAPLQCWMRNFGFCVEYDILCYILPNWMYNYRTRRIKFEYGDKEWMVQIWKGTYLITNGGEVGVYNRDIGTLGTFYDCIGNDELMPMSLQVYHGNDLLVNVDEMPHWWVNGFKMGDRMYSPHSLTMKFTITLYDEEMVKAFCEGIDRNIYHDIEYTVDGLTVSCVWDT